MPTIRRVDPMVVHQYQVASVLASMFARKSEIDADAAIQGELDQFREWCKSVLSVAALALYVAVVFWPLLLAK